MGARYVVRRGCPDGAVLMADPVRALDPTCKRSDGLRKIVSEVESIAAGGKTAFADLNRNGKASGAFSERLQCLLTLFVLSRIAT
jgi:hypothetical protein